MDNVSKIFKVKYPIIHLSKAESIACHNPELVCGIELEVEHTKDIDEYLSLLQGAWNIEEDGSLRRNGGYAYEFISKPLPLTKLLGELYSFFDHTEFSDRNYSDRCSIHVHTNVTNFNQEQLSSLVLVYTVIEDVLFQFVNQYKAKDTYGYCRDTNIYCIPWNQCKLNHKLVSKLFNNPVNEARDWKKYTALNLIPICTLGTVEWRHMHGTSDMQKISMWLNMIGSIMSYAENTSFKELIKTIKQLNDNSAYHAFFDSIFNHSLEYNDSYRTALYEGVVNAKYSLYGWDKKDTKMKLPAQEYLDLMWPGLPRQAQIPPIDVLRQDNLVPVADFLVNHTEPGPENNL